MSADAEQVVAAYREWSVRRLRLHQDVQWDHFAGERPNVVAVDVARIAAEFRFGLRHHAERASEQVEVVHVEAAQKSLHRLIDIHDGNAHRASAFAIHLQTQLRLVGDEGGDHLSERGVLPGGRQEGLRHTGKPGDVAAGTVLQFHVEAAGIAQAGDRRRIEDQDECALESEQLALQAVDNSGRLFLRLRALVPWLHDADESAHAGGRVALDEAGSAERDDVGDARRLPQDGFGLLHHSRRTFQRCTVRESEIDDEPAFVFGGKEPRRRDAVELPGGAEHRKQQNRDDGAATDECLHDAGVGAKRSIEGFVEGAEERASAGSSCARLPSSAAERTGRG